jgi:hypothetical protein
MSCGCARVKTSHYQHSWTSDAYGNLHGAMCIHTFNHLFPCNWSTTHWYVSKLVVLIFLGVLYTPRMPLSQYLYTGPLWWQCESFPPSSASFLHNSSYLAPQPLPFDILTFQDIIRHFMTSMPLVHILGTSLTWWVSRIAFLVIFTSNLFHSLSLHLRLFSVI